jgi:hypothetical protein
MNIIEPTFRNVMGHETYVFNVCIIVYCDIVIVQLFFVSIHLMSLGHSKLSKWAIFTSGTTSDQTSSVPVGFKPIKHRF